MTVKQKEAEKVSIVGQPVWLVEISHRHGRDVTVYASAKAADDAVAGYVDSFWLDEMGKAKRPRSDQKMVDAVLRDRRE